MYGGAFWAPGPRLLLGVPLVLFVISARAAAACLDPAALTHSTVSITKHFSEEERKKDTTLLGIRGTAWFLSPRLLVTAAHVAQSMDLSDQEWKQIELGGVESEQPALVRVQRLAGPEAEKIALLELRATFPAAEPLRIRMEPLTANEPLVSLAYPGNRLRIASGRFVNYGDGGKLSGTAMLEMADGDDRLVLDHGASGAPVLDCEGRVVAVVSNIFARTMSFMSQAIRISTAWGSPNIVAVPISVLKQPSTPE